MLRKDNINSDSLHNIWRSNNLDEGDAVRSLIKKSKLVLALGTGKNKIRDKGSEKLRPDSTSEGPERKYVSPDPPF